jgi:hypothetical protein
MSYAIGNIIFGVPIPFGSDLVKALAKEPCPGDDDTCMNIMDNNESAGFFRCYEGTNPAWFGVNLGEIDETEDVDLNSLPRVTDAVRATYTERLSKLPDHLRTLFPEPRWMIVWSSS